MTHDPIAKHVKVSNASVVSVDPKHILASKGFADQLKAYLKSKEKLKSQPHHRRQA